MLCCECSHGSLLPIGLDKILHVQMSCQLKLWNGLDVIKGGERFHSPHKNQRGCVEQMDDTWKNRCLWLHEKNWFKVSHCHCRPTTADVEGVRYLHQRGSVSCLSKRTQSSEWTLMRFSGNADDGTGNSSLNVGSILEPSGPRNYLLCEIGPFIHISQSTIKGQIADKNTGSKFDPDEEICCWWISMDQIPSDNEWR